MERSRFQGPENVLAKVQAEGKHLARTRLELVLEVPQGGRDGGGAARAAVTGLGPLAPARQLPAQARRQPQPLGAWRIRLGAGVRGPDRLRRPRPGRGGVGTTSAGFGSLGEIVVGPEDEGAFCRTAGGRCCRSWRRRGKGPAAPAEGRGRTCFRTSAVKTRRPLRGGRVLRRRSGRLSWRLKRIMSRVSERSRTPGSPGVGSMAPLAPFPGPSPNDHLSMDAQEGARVRPKILWPGTQRTY
jgi:hypothetical protein